MTGIYKITNKINGKVYIGKAKNICERWNKHYLDSYSDKPKDNSLIHKAIKKYGIENFTFEIEEICDVEDLSNEERYFIKYYNSFGDNGYNLTPGGDGCEKFGEDNGNSKLTEDDVYNIREEYKLLHRKRDVYKKYQHIISINTFSDIWTGKTWKGVHYDVYTDENKQLQRNNYDKVKSHESISVVSEEEVKMIRNLKNDLLSKKYTYETYFSYLNINTFNDIWYYRTYKHILADNTPKRGKRHRECNQEGCLNPSSIFTEEQVKIIRKRKGDGEDMKSVYADYTFSNFSTFRNLWNGKTYKNIDSDL